MRFALLALILSVCCTAAVAADEQSVINHGAPQPAATGSFTAAPAIIACAENCSQTEVCSKSRHRCRCGVARRAARGTVEVSRTVVRTVTRPLARVRGACCCN